MKERSLMERIVAILGVLIGTIAWVVRLLFSLVSGLLRSGSRTDDEEGQANAAADIRAKSESLVEDIREKGGHLVEEAREKVEDVFEEAREKVEDVIHRGDDHDDDQDEFGFTHAGASGDDVSSSQHDRLGGVPDASRMEATAAASLSTMSETYDPHAAGSVDENDGEETGHRMTEGIDHLPEPGAEDDADRMYGSESGSLMGEDRESGYAGQVMSESDIGAERGDSVSGLADSEGRADGGFSHGWISDEVDPVEDEAQVPDISFEGEEYGAAWISDQIDPAEAQPEETTYDSLWVEDQVDPATLADEEGEVPAASRGWTEPEDDVLKNDPLYGDVEPSDTGGEVDLRNDELTAADGAGMHIIDSPDEPFIEDESAAESLGLMSSGTEPPFDTMSEDEVDIDRIGEEPVVVGEDDLAANALGQPAGDDAASGDLGPGQSGDDASRPEGESRSDGDVQGAYDGAGVDQFADDSVAREMLDDVRAEGEEETEAETDADASASSGDDASGSEETDSGAGSIAWASSAGVIDRTLTQPLSSEELQSGSDADADVDAGEPGVTEADAGLRDVAAEVAEDLDQETGGRDTATGTTMAGAGQSAGAMTSDDAANEEPGPVEMTEDTGSFEAGGTTSPDEGTAAEEQAGDEDTGKRMGVGSGTSFDDVLPESEYASSVGYDTLKVDDGAIGQGTLEVEPSSSVSSDAPNPAAPRSGGRGQRATPAGAVRGDGTGTCPAEFPIKGNASSRIYHRPTDPSYDSTIPELCFATEEDAKAAGFRARKM